jgi:hypothetical protein
MQRLKADETLARTGICFIHRAGREKMAAQTKWRLSGDYFENCNCDVVCPCLVSSAAPLTARPSQGVCDVALVFHIDKGNYGQVSLDGLIDPAAIILNEGWTPPRLQI